MLSLYSCIYYNIVKIFSQFNFVRSAYILQNYFYKYLRFNHILITVSCGHELFQNVVTV